MLLHEHCICNCPGPLAGCSSPLGRTPLIKYIGSKRLLVPRIVSVVTALGGGRVMDVFSGTSRVGRALKAQGMQVIANDQLAYAATLGRCYVQADATEVRGEVERVLAELRQVAPRPGYFTETFCEKARFFHPKNGARVDAMRDRIAALSLAPDIEAVCLVSLMEAADRVDSTTGVQMAYLKQWAARANNDLELRMPDILPGRGEALQMDAIDAVRAREVDVAYLDPPYNQHRYLGNYHIWETLVRWDAPETYGIAQKRVDCRERHTPFNSRKQIHDALAALIRDARARHLVVSFSNEGFVTIDELAGLLAERGHVGVVATQMKRYVGATIGQHNPQGERVGTISHLHNKEFLFVASPDQSALTAAMDALGAEEYSNSGSVQLQLPLASR
jgi:adenine-specific DNA-methyltransferase